MDEALPELHESIVNNGYPEDIAEYTIELIKPFVG